MSAYKVVGDGCWLAEDRSKLQFVVWPTIRCSTRRDDRSKFGVVDFIDWSYAAVFKTETDMLNLKKSGNLVSCSTVSVVKGAKSLWKSKRWDIRIRARTRVFSFKSLNNCNSSTNVSAITCILDQVIHSYMLIFADLTEIRAVGDSRSDASVAVAVANRQNPMLNRRKASISLRWAKVYRISRKPNMLLQKPKTVLPLFRVCRTVFVLHRRIVTVNSAPLVVSNTAPWRSKFG